MPDTPDSIKPFSLNKNKSLLNDKFSTSLKVSAVSDPLVLAALAANTPFPGGDIKFGEFQLEAGTASPIVFKSGAGSVSFQAKAGVFGGFSLSGSSAKLLAPLQKGPFQELPSFEIPDVADSRHALLSWGYDLSASATGGVALGPAAISVGVSADSQGFFGVLTSIPDSTPARAAIERATDCWILPSMIKDPTQLNPRTWVFSEVAATVGVKIGAQLGLDFNWVREAELEGLKGDIGLRLQTAVSASLGFKASGRWLAVVSRESEAFTLRLQLYRLAQRDINFALDAGATFQASLDFLPAKADDFLKAVLGVHGAQILKDLAVVEKWTDPNKKLTELLAGESIEEAKGLIATLADVPVGQLNQSFDLVRERVVGLLDKWNELPHRISTQVMSLVSEHAPLEALRGFLKQVSDASSSEGLKDLLTQELGSPDFFSSPLGRWVEAASDAGALSLIGKPLADVKRLADQTLGLLDSSVVEATLGRLQGFLNDALQVDKITTIVTQADFNKLDALFKKKLAGFLGQADASLVKVDEVRETIGLLLRKRQEFYEKALQALQRSYSASLTATFSSTTTSTAQIDAEFDFSGNPAGLAEAFHSALSGDFDRILTTPQQGLRLRLGELTHGIKRRSHIELSLPFFNAQSTHLNQSMASLKATESEGRVLVYGLDSSDSVATNHRNSTLSLALHYSTLPTIRGLNVHEPPSFALSYSLRQYLPRLDRSDVLHQIAPLFEQYFPDRITDQKLALYLDSFNQRTEAVIPDSPDFYGDALLSLQTTFTADQGGAMGKIWLGLGDQESDPAYLSMSLFVQSALKRIVVEAYFQSPERYVDLLPAQVLLAWASIPQVNGVSLVGNKPKVTGGGLHWNWPDLAIREAMLRRQPQTAIHFQEHMVAASERLKSNPTFKGTAKFYKPADAGSILGGIPVDDPRLEGLLFVEATLIRDIFEAGKKMSAFGKNAGANPSRAVKQLALFGSKMTETFNRSASSVYLGSISGALGTALYVAALQGLSRGELNLTPTAFMRLAVMRPNFQFNAANFIRDGVFPEADIVVNDQIAS